MSKLAHSNDETMEEIEINNLKEDGYTDEEIEEMLDEGNMQTMRQGDG